MRFLSDKAVDENEPSKALVDRLFKRIEAPSVVLISRKIDGFF